MFVSESPTENHRQKRITKAVVFGALATLLLITFLSSMRSIDTGKVGVVTQYGKVTGRELGEGFAWVLPWGINNVTTYDVKTQKQEVNAQAATNDLQDVSGTLVLNYRLNRGDVSNIHQSVGSDYQDKVITPIINEVFKAASAKYSASELITKRPEVKADVTKSLQDRLAKRGITVEDVNITNLQFSQAFNASIEATQVAQQEVIKARNELEKTKVEAEKKIAEAQGAAEAQRLQQQTLTQQMLQKQAIEKWDGKLPTTFAGDASTLFNIPLR